MDFGGQKKGPVVKTKSKDDSSSGDRWRSLQKSRIHALGLGLWDAILCMTTICFFLQTVLCLSRNGTLIKQSDPKEHLLRINRLMPTVFPIVFAAVTGTLVRRLALFRVQNGAPLGVVEQLQGSVSFARTLQFAYYLQNPGLSFVLITFWSLSPLGGQAFLRQLEIGQTITQRTDTFWYPDAYHSNRTRDSGKSLATNMVYFETLRTPWEMMHTPRDSWGRVRIPWPRFTSGNVSSDVEGNENATYISIRGIPLYRKLLADNSSMSADIIYMEPSCWKASRPNRTLETNYNFGASLAESAGVVDTVDLIIENKFWGKCNVSSRFARAHIECKPRCAIVSSTVDRSRNESIQTAFKADAAFFKRFSEASRPREMNLSIQDLISNTGGHGYNSSIGPDPAMATRLFGVLLNTYWNSGFAWPNKNKIVHLSTRLKKVTLDSATMIQGPRSIYVQHAMYRSSTLWAFFAMLSSLALIAGAISSAALELRIFAPDILGYVSSAVTENDAFAKDQADYSSTMSGLERAQLFSKRRVALAERGERIALADADRSWTKLKRGKAYS